MKSLRADEPGEPKPPNKELPASGDQDQQSALKGRKKQRRQEKRQETGLLNALERLVTRAKKEPEGGRGSSKLRNEDKLVGARLRTGEKQETTMKEEQAPRKKAEVRGCKNICRGPLEKGPARIKSTLRPDRGKRRLQ